MNNSKTGWQAAEEVPPGGDMMTNQEKIEYLRGYRTAELEIGRLEEEIARTRSRGERVTAALQQLPSHGGMGDRVQSAVEAVDMLLAALLERQTALVGLRLRIDRAICSVSDERLRLVLRYRYVSGWPWERIAAAMQLQYRWTLRLHSRALAEIKDEAIVMHTEPVL